MAGQPLRCSSCGRFLGYIDIEVGEVILFCKNCKGWTAFMAGRDKSLLDVTELVRQINERAEWKRK